MKNRLTFLLGLFLLAVSCVQGPEYEIRSVTVDVASLKIPVGGSADFLFRVDEADYAFDLSKDVELYLNKGPFLASTNYYLERVERDSIPGLYRAYIKDRGVCDDYYDEVTLGVRKPGGDGMLLSAPFYCEGEYGGPLGPVKKTGLPILYLDTQYGAAITSKETYVPAGVSLQEAGSKEVSEPLSCSVRGRGNTTWYWPKKPYLLKFDSKVSFFGFPAHKRWVLLANFMDRTMMRNLVAMKVSSMTKLAWTPRCRSVELVLNGKHQGTYLLIEQVRVDKNRVAVGDDGWLLESDFHYDNEVQWMDPHGHCVQFSSGIPFGIKNPYPDDIKPDQIAEIKQYISETAGILYGASFADPEAGYASRLDVASFIDYWIVFEVMGNHELGNPGSVFYHRKPGGKLTAGPCWDFDWGVLSYTANPKAQTGLLNRNACWYSRLFEDPAFHARVKARFEELLPQLQTIPDYIDELEKQLSKSAVLNFQMWNPAEDAWTNGGHIINGDENMSFTEAVARLKSIYQERLTVIQDNL